jgi:CDP-diacylglycerol--serine O-phosphatidyltransferase
MKGKPKNRKVEFQFRNPFSRDPSLQRRPKRLKHIAFLPSFITLINGACGFIAIVLASDGHLALAAYVVLVAMVADVLDGRVARLTRTTSSFGGQLDSLSDAISFGVAPAFLMFNLVERYLNFFGFEDVEFSVFLVRVIIVSAVLYAMCAIVRLARFNVENDEDEAAHMNFAGLPSPAAAGVVVSTVIFHQQILPQFGFVDTASHAFHVATVSAFPAITVLAGVLMVSRIRYPHVANQLIRSKKSLGFLMTIFATVLLVIWNIQIAMVAAFCGFALFGVIRWIVGLFRKPHQKEAPSVTAATNVSADNDTRAEE